MIVTLTTDFGTCDSYVGAIKGVILGIAPTATIVDISHDIAPQNITAAALCVEALTDTFADTTIHLAVVDPGVGTERAAVAITTDRGTFVGPDNGLFTLAVDRCGSVASVRLTNPKYHRHPVSDTFHGRDIFAPAAAYLANGIPPRDLGDPHDNLVRLNLPTPTQDTSGLTIHVIHVDHFGNLVTNLTRSELTKRWPNLTPDRFEVTIEGTCIGTIRRTYHDMAVGQALAYFGSTDRLEIAVRDGSAARILDLSLGKAIRLTTEA